MSTYAIGRRLRLTDSFGLTMGGFVVSLVTVIVAFIAILSVLVIGLSRHYGRISCANWSAETGYPSKFVILNTASGGTCLARTPSGRWVVNSKVIEVVPALKP